MLTHLMTVDVLYHLPEDGWITGRNTLNVLYVKMHCKITVHLFVVYTFYRLINE